jgi:hypothetical protein
MLQQVQRVVQYVQPQTQHQQIQYVQAMQPQNYYTSISQPQVMGYGGGVQYIQSPQVPRCLSVPPGIYTMRMQVPGYITMRMQVPGYITFWSAEISTVFLGVMHSCLCNM